MGVTGLVKKVFSARLGYVYGTYCPGEGALDRHVVSRQWFHKRKDGRIGFSAKKRLSFLYITSRWDI